MTNVISKSPHAKITLETKTLSSWGAVLVADLVTQLPELVNLAAGKASAGEI